MKKSILMAALCAAAAASTPLHAQDGPAEAHKRAMEHYPPRIGLKAGLNAANLTIDNAGTVNDKKAVPSWHAGLFADLPLMPVLSVQPGLFLNSKGAKFTLGNTSDNNYTEVSTHPLYLELPVNLVAKLPLPGKVKLFTGAGPYIAAGIGGKNKLEGKVLGISFSKDEAIEYGNDAPQNGSNGGTFSGDIKRFDFGINMLAGIEISHFVLNAGYGYGLVNIKPGADNDNSKYHNRVASVSVGLML